MPRNKVIVFILIALMCSTASFAQKIIALQQGKSTSIRGLSVVDDSVVWLSGSKGTVAITRNGGKTWEWQQVNGFETSDFRDIEAFSGKEAIIMSSGTPALILKTIDGGASWQVKYKNTDTAYFFDAMDFANQQHGYILGDPINNKFLLMETEDGGDHWHIFKNCPNAVPNEAAFAASGTCLRVNNDKLIIVSGGSKSHMITYFNNGNKWDYWQLPIKQGKASLGAFSFAASPDQYSKVFVGGDYSNDHSTDSVATYLQAHDQYIKLASQAPRGYQSCVEYISGEIFLSTGTPGSNITTDGGKTWKEIDAASYNVCRKAKRGKLVLFAGNNGAIGLLKL